MSTAVLEVSGHSRTANATSQRIVRLAGDARAVGIEFFLASSTPMHQMISAEPLGVPLQRIDVLRPPTTSWSSTDFLKLFNQANAYAFGPRGLPMPYWVMLDLALMPSGLVVAAASAGVIRGLIEEGSLQQSKSSALEQLLDLADELDYDGPIPVAGYCAAPTADRERWAGWSLWSILPGFQLGLIVKGLALQAYGARYLEGITQFDNDSIRIHTAFGPLRVRSARLDLHTSDNAFVYECDLSGSTRISQSPSFLLDPSDVSERARMQGCIDAGTHDYYILPPGTVTGVDRSYLPILEVARSAAEEFIDVTR